MHNSWRKAPDGAWQISGEAAGLVVGRQIVVRRKDGSTSIETVQTVTPAGTMGGVAMALAVPMPSPARTAARAPESNERQHRRARKWWPCGYPGCNPNHCDECDGLGAGAMREGW